MSVNGYAKKNKKTFFYGLKMPRGRPRKYAGPLQPGKRSARVPGRTGLNRTEKKQTSTIARRTVFSLSETKHRAWLYPKTTYSEMLHNKPFFLFGGDDPDNGLLNLDRGDSSRPRPEGGGLPKTKPGQCREGTQVRLLSLQHKCILSGDGPNKNTLVRMILFSYPTGKGGIVEGDILLQPDGTGLDQGWPNIFLKKNTYNGKGIRFLKDRIFQVRGESSGAIAIDGDAPNWGLSGVRVVDFHHHFKGGRVIKYAQGPTGTDSDVPATFNYGIMIIPYGSGVTTQDEACGRIEILGDMLFKDM